MSDGTFRPSGVTPWSAYNTPRIWAMVQGEDDPEAWRQVAALGSMAGLLKDQRSRLEVAKQKLIDAWPPEHNKAARAFVDEIDELLFTMRVNKDIAESNAGALSQILEALRQAKEKIAPIYQAYLDKSDDWMPGWWDHAEEELDEQARRHMREAEELVGHPDNTITAPSRYEFQADETRIRSGDGSGGDGSSGRPGAGNDDSIGAADSIEVPHDPPPPLPRQESVSSGTPGLSPAPGPSLAEVITPVPAVPTNPTPNVAATAGGTPGAPPLPGLIIGGGFPGGFPGGSPARGAAGSAGGRPFGGEAQRGLPSGAVISNSAPGRGPVGPVKPAPPWLPPASGQAPRAGAGRTGGRSAALPALPMGAGRRPACGDRDAEITFDADSTWATAQGVAPVIEPSRKRYRHDPGPGVIGWHG